MTTLRVVPVEWLERIANTPIASHRATEDLARLQIDAVRLLQALLPAEIEKAVELAERGLNVEFEWDCNELTHTENEYVYRALLRVCGREP